MTSPDILANPGESRLGMAVQENLFAMFRAMAGRLPGGELVESPRFSMHHSAPQSPTFKGVWGTDLAAAAVDAAVDDAIAWFRKRRAPFFFWWTGPGTSPGDLGDRLQARGLIAMSGPAEESAHGSPLGARGAPGMFADLSSVDESLMEKAPTGFIVEEVQDADALDDFKQVLMGSYGFPDWAAQAWVDPTLALGFGRTPWKLYVGRLLGKAVASNLIFCGAGVAGVYAVGVLPEARGRGVGAAVTLGPLLDARQCGYRHAVLYASEMAVGVYRRIGFQLTDVRINRYLWRENHG
jgi:ribosomal protein S18 acetylase RimI-like enzyme